MSEAIKGNNSTLSTYILMQNNASGKDAPQMLGQSSLS